MPLVVIGCGGHAKVVIATARDAGFDVTAIADDDPDALGRRVLGVEVTGSTARVLGDAAAAVVIAIGSNVARGRLARDARCHFVTVVHPCAVVHPTVQLAPGTVVFAGAVIQPDAVLGAHVIVNTGASIDHDCSIGDCVHIAPGARLAGNVTVGEGAILGIGSAVIPGITIGAWTTVGAGAAVVRDLPGGVTAVGVPARPLRP